MSARRWLVAIAAVAAPLPAASACRQIAGIEDIRYDDAGPSACPSTTATAVFQQTGASFDKLSVQSGVLYAGLFDNTASMEVGAVSCPVGGCSAPTQLARNDTSWGDFSVAPSLVYYSLTGTALTLADGGTAPANDGVIHSVKLDGTGDVVASGGLPYPYWLATSGSRLFWVNDPTTFGDNGTSSVECIGCSGTTSVPWITGLGATYQVFADQSSVYVLADDSVSTTGTLYGCSVQNTCSNGSPRTVISQLDLSGTGDNSFASDGTNVFAARAGHTDIIRIDPSGLTSTIATGQQGATGLAYDAAQNELYWGTSTGVIYRVKADGTGEPQSVVCQQSSPRSLAVDGSFVYFVTGASGGDANVVKVPKPP